MWLISFSVDDGIKVVFEGLIILLFAVLLHFECGCNILRCFYILKFDEWEDKKCFFKCIEFGVLIDGGIFFDMRVWEETVVDKGFIDFVGDIFFDNPIEEFWVLESYKGIEFVAAFFIIDFPFLLLCVARPIEEVAAPGEESVPFSVGKLEDVG